jgi:hypothetical protein
LRLWTLHPKYLDAPGLVALWREALLARAVLRGRTRGYRDHPQLERFRSCPAPRRAINVYLASIHAEALRRGYTFDRTKFLACECSAIGVTEAQLAYEWDRLLAKLRARNPSLYRVNRRIAAPAAHPLFRIDKGPVADWERR